MTEMAGDIPVEVLLRWIKHESGGNPCSTGKIVNGTSIENGLFQLYSPDDDHIATPAQLHGSFCRGQTCIRDLTLDEARIQVASGIAYVRICRERARAQLKQGGVSWDETGSDFWSLVKMQHNLPSVPKQYIPKLHPSSWSEFKESVLKEQPKYANTTIFTKQKISSGSRVDFYFYERQRRDEANESTEDSEQQSEQQPVEGDEPAENPINNPLETDQAAEQSGDHPDSDQSTSKRKNKLPTISRPSSLTKHLPARRTVTEQTEEQPAESEQPAEQSIEPNGRRRRSSHIDRRCTRSAGALYVATPLEA
jgi:hypothetical protein